MSHYHEVYFNKHTQDGPRVGMTRRHKADIFRARAADGKAGKYMHPDARIVRCERPDNQCPWTVDGVPI